MNSRYRWERNGFPVGSHVAGWHLFSVPGGGHLGTVYVDGSWFTTREFQFVHHQVGSQPLAAQALLRAAGVEP